MLDRYNRLQLIDWFDIENVRNTHVIVIGAGAIGNEVLKNLTLLGIGQIDIFDFDSIEKHNLTRSVLFRESDIGKNKAEIAAQVCRQIDPNVTINPYPKDLWGHLSIENIKSVDAIICCVDNFEARIDLNRLCLLAGTDFYNTGIDSRHVTVELFPFRSSPDCSCYECNIPSGVYENIQQRYSCGYLLKTAENEQKIPTTTITSSIAGAMVSSILLNRINKHPQSFNSSTRCYIDVISMNSTISEFSQKPNCPICNEFGEESIVVTTKRGGDFQINQVEGTNDNFDIKFSEPIILKTVCSICGAEQEYYATTRNLNVSITFCSYCKEFSIKPIVIEKLPYNEFKTFFTSRHIPGKYLAFHIKNQKFIFELED